MFGFVRMSAQRPYQYEAPNQDRRHAQTTSDRPLEEA
jgi:hypothetical protein